MNTKVLMTCTSLALGLAGVLALFVPENVLAIQSLPVSRESSVFVQLLGALYFSMALMDWTAKDSIIGGIYARPVSLGNFAHFFVGTLILARYFWSNGFNIPVFSLLVIYGILAVLYYWLVFRHTGVAVKDKSQPGSE